MKKEDATKVVIDFFTPHIHSVEWDEKREGYKISVSLGKALPQNVWVGESRVVFYEDDFAVIDESFDIVDGEEKCE